MRWSIIYAAALVSFTFFFHPYKHTRELRNIIRNKAHNTTIEYNTRNAQYLIYRPPPPGKREFIFNSSSEYMIFYKDDNNLIAAIFGRPLLLYYYYTAYYSRIIYGT